MNPFSSLPDAGITRIRATAAMLGVSTQTVYNWIEAGHLPKPLRFGPNASGFANSSLKEFGEQLVRTAK